MLQLSFWIAHVLAVLALDFAKITSLEQGFEFKKKKPLCFCNIFIVEYTVNISTVLSTAFGSVTCATVIWLYILQPKIAIDLKLYSSMSARVVGTAVGCDNHCQITVAHVTQSMTVNWL